jgi:hypothetical protein
MPPAFRYAFDLSRLGDAVAGTSPAKDPRRFEHQRPDVRAIPRSPSMPRLRSLRPTLLAAVIALAAGGAWLGLSSRSADAQQMQGGAPMPWQQQIANALPIFGSGNWVIVASTDFPLLSVNGVETIRVPDGLAAAVNSMEGIFQMSNRMRPNFHLASELDFAAKQNDDAKAYMDELAKILPENGVTKMPADDHRHRRDEADPRAQDRLDDSLRLGRDPTRTRLLGRRAGAGAPRRDEGWRLSEARSRAGRAVIRPRRSPRRGDGRPGS